MVSTLVSVLVLVLSIFVGHPIRWRGLSFYVFTIASVPHSKSGIVPRSSLLGAGQLGFWEVGKGGTIG